MAIGRSSFNIKTTIQGQPVTVSVAGTYARLPDIHTVNRYNSELIPNPAKVVGDKLPDNIQVFNKTVEVVGKLDIYANAADPAKGIPPLFAGQEYSCAHAAGAPVEAELYTYIMALPEFSGCAAV